MAHYYFDLQYGDMHHTDDEGEVLKRRGDASREMVQTLAEVGRDIVSRPGESAVVGVVRDDKGVLWRGRLSLEVQRLEPSERRVA